MLHIVNVEEIQGCLLSVPQLVALLERRDPQFTIEVKMWLMRLEDILVGNRLPLAGSIAALRAVLSSAERGVVPAGVAIRGHPTPRKIREATAVDVLRQSSELLASAIREDTTRLGEAERVGSQIVAVAKSLGLLPAQSSVMGGSGGLKALWRVLSADPNIKAGAVHLESLMGQNDALIVLDRAITANQ